MASRELNIRFWSKVDRGEPDDCWLWTAARDPNGYGRFGIGKPARMRLAHRVAWEFEKGPVGDGQRVCHRCDTPPCVNPAHMFLGTQAENLADMRRKGRERHARGVEHGKARLTEQQVRSIRRSTDTLRSLAARFGVSYTSIRYIQIRRNWAWLPDEEAA